MLQTTTIILTLIFLVGRIIKRFSIGLFFSPLVFHAYKINKVNKIVEKQTECLKEWAKKVDQQAASSFKYHDSTKQIQLSNLALSVNHISQMSADLHSRSIRS